MNQNDYVDDASMELFVFHAESRQVNEQHSTQDSQVFWNTTHELNQETMQRLTEHPGYDLNQIETNGCLLIPVAAHARDEKTGEKFPISMAQFQNGMAVNQVIVAWPAEAIAVGDGQGAGSGRAARAEQMAPVALEPFYEYPLPVTLGDLEAATDAKIAVGKYSVTTVETIGYIKTIRRVGDDDEMQLVVHKGPGPRVRLLNRHRPDTIFLQWNLVRVIGKLVEDGEVFLRGISIHQVASPYEMRAHEMFAAKAKEPTEIVVPQGFSHLAQSLGFPKVRLPEISRSMLEADPEPRNNEGVWPEEMMRLFERTE